jgi:hypothetical protein
MRGNRPCSQLNPPPTLTFKISEVDSSAEALSSWCFDNGVSIIVMARHTVVWTSSYLQDKVTKPAL